MRRLGRGGAGGRRGDGLGSYWVPGTPLSPPPAPNPGGSHSEAQMHARAAWTWAVMACLLDGVVRGLLAALLVAPTRSGPAAPTRTHAHVAAHAVACSPTAHPCMHTADAVPHPTHSQGPRGGQGGGRGRGESRHRGGGRGPRRCHTRSTAARAPHRQVHTHKQAFITYAHIRNACAASSRVEAMHAHARVYV
jgi:hypothetical protein